MKKKKLLRLTDDPKVSNPRPQTGHQVSIYIINQQNFKKKFDSFLQIFIINEIPTCILRDFRIEIT